MLKSKAAMDQFSEGLEVLDVLGMVRINPGIMKPLFVDEQKPLTAGLLFAIIVIDCHTKDLLNKGHLYTGDGL